ncbi:hypothetical protein ACCS64_40170, partial [Rhizobium ruizarguesonis]
RAWDKRCITAICCTDPEIGSAGLSAVDARVQGYEIRTGQFPFSANGRAMTISGSVKQMEGMHRLSQARFFPAMISA